MTLDCRQEETLVTEKKRGRHSAKHLVNQTKQTVWRVSLQIHENTRENRPFDPDGFFILITSITDHRVKSDRRLLEAYKGQYVVETGFKWLKGPLAASPLFLQLPS